jgi:HEAT repeat protein
VPALREALKLEGVQTAAVLILGRIGREASVAVAALKEALQDGDEEVRNSAARSLKQIDSVAASRPAEK